MASPTESLDYITAEQGGAPIEIRTPLAAMKIIFNDDFRKSYWIESFTLFGGSDDLSSQEQLDSCFC
jgi:hypothetical protein